MFILMAVASLGALAIAFAATISSWNTAVQPVIIGVVASVLTSVAIGFARLLTLRKAIPLRLATTGQREAGKTVFANLLFDHLMNSGEHLYSFTPESRSAIAVYQAVRGMAVEDWPPATVKGSVIQYDGQIRLSSRSFINVEIGDSAGEHWIALDARSARAEEADYVAWVLSAQVIAHVVSVETLRPQPGALGSQRDQLAADAEDLRLIGRLMKSAGGERKRQPTLLVVLSKADLIMEGSHAAREEFSERLEKVLYRVFSANQLIDDPSVRAIVDPANLDFSKLYRFSREVEGAFAELYFTFSSIESLISDQRAEIGRRIELITVLIDSARRYARSGGLRAR